MQRRRDKTPLTRSTWTEAAAASTASAATRPRLSRARRRRPTTQRCGTLRSLARRLASPFFLPATTSYHEVLTVAQQAESNAARTEAEASRPDEGFCHAAPRPSLLRLLPPPYPSISLFAGTSPKSVGGVAGGTRRQQHTRFGRGGRRRHGQSDGPPPRVIYVLITALLDHRSTKTALRLQFQEVDFFMNSPYHNTTQMNITTVLSR